MIPLQDSQSALADLAKQVFRTLDVCEATRQGYADRIGYFIDSLDRLEITRDSYLAFKRQLAARTDLSVSTKNTRLVAARIFCRELHRLGYLPFDPSAHVHLFRQTTGHKKLGITEPEMARLAHAIRTLDVGPQTARLSALVALLALQGLRQCEISRLDVLDIDLAGMRAFIRGKGQDDKEAIDLHPETVRALSEYFTALKRADGPLFGGMSNNSKRLTTRGIRLVVGTTLDRLGIDKTTHGFRHFFTTRLVQAYKGDLLTVAQYTRHKSLQMLQVYNDAIKRREDLPRFYQVFDGVTLDCQADEISKKSANEGSIGNSDNEKS